MDKRAKQSGSAHQCAIQRELNRHATLFDTIESSPLTQEQRVAAVTMATRNLLIAAAGSGKTSTMIGKVAYALCSGLCPADGILVLAFNRKAAGELDDRLRRRLAPFLAPGKHVTAQTLHALGLNIVTQVRGQRPAVQGADTDVLSMVLTQLVQEDTEFSEHWLLFRVFYHAVVRHPDQFETTGQWHDFVRQQGDTRQGRYGFLSLRDELLPTQFEQAVANWLHLHDITYIYAPLSRYSSWLMWLAGRFLSPLSGRMGFFLPSLGRYVICLGKWNLDCRQRGQDIVITVGDFRTGTVFQTLRKHLCPTGRTLKKDRMATLMARLGQPLTPGQTEFLERFIRVARLGRIAPDKLAARARAGGDPVRTTLHAPMLIRLLSAYNQALEDSETIDFEGMLHRAADYLEQGLYRHSYTLILVDEFQDTSAAGLRLLQALLAQNSDCRFFAVGDDWQSIYRFAGAVPDVLTCFEQHFGASAINYLTSTFRFSTSVANLATRFAQANPAQVRKHVQARRADQRDAVMIGRYTSLPDMFVLCKACLADSIASLAWTGQGSSTSTPILSVYILGRYRHQCPPQLKQWQTHFTQLNIEFQTVHAAKGLEADVVIVLGLSQGRYGFPSHVPDDPLMNLVMPEAETFEHAEERRLFYVALTRCRYRVYLLAALNQPSPFVTELTGLAGTSGRAEPDGQVPGLFRLC